MNLSFLKSSPRKLVHMFISSCTSLRCYVLYRVNTSVVVTGLTPFTFYEFQVRAHTDYTDGEFSGEVQCRTDEGSKLKCVHYVSHDVSMDAFFPPEPSPPLNPQWSLQSPSVVQLQWQPPAQKNGIIVSYLILYRKDLVETMPHWDHKMENGSSTSALVADLDTDAVYYFKLRAVTGRGAGPDSEMLQVRTHSLSGNEPFRGEYMQ